jgi:hypothetical protein
MDILFALNIFESILFGALFIFLGMILTNYWGLLLESVSGSTVSKDIFHSENFRRLSELIKFTGNTMIIIGLLKILVSVFTPFLRT